MQPAEKLIRRLPNFALTILAFVVAFVFGEYLLKTLRNEQRIQLRNYRRGNVSS